ncbi:MAG: hypothetical protein J5995_00625 [Muribaculaceae bacterium]|nr:hypothetical protein [Muribaculaceae bacterium]
MDNVKYCYVKSEVNPEEPICQYLDLDFLLKLLSTKTYFVKFKGNFPDVHESELPLKDMFPIYCANYNPDKDKVKQDICIMSDKLEKYRHTSTIPTSCWTLRDAESSLMWHNYTTKLGACIKSTVSNFISAIDFTEYDLLYGKIAYHGYHFYQESFLFSKDSSYADEKELRFYFIPKNGTDTVKKTNGISLMVKPDELIEEIILSPHIEPRAASELCIILTEKYGIKVRPSKIHIDIH